MKNLTKLLWMLALVVLTFSCVTPEGPNGITTGNGPLLKVDATPAGGFTRATDTAFEKGDSFGLFGIKGVGFQNLTPENFADVLLSMESWIVNGKFTKSDGGFVGDQEYKWYEGDQVSSFMALYPYTSGTTTSEVLFEGVDFCVKSDQSTHAGYTASDLMGAYKEGVAPTDQAVRLEFNHLLSKVVIDLNNQTGEEIEEVYLDGVRGNMTYSLITSGPTGDYGTIKAGEQATPTEGFTNTFVLIIPAQSATPKVAITTASGKQYTFEASEAISFGIAKKRQITVTLTPESISTSFDAIVNDWSADESVEFKDQPGGGGGGDPVVPAEEGYKVVVAGKEYTINKSDEGGWGTILLPIYADVNEFQIIDKVTGATLGGSMTSSAMNLRLTEGVDKVVLPKVELYTEYELTLVTEGEGAPYLKMQPIKVGEFDTYLGRGVVVEQWVLGIMSPADVLTDARGRYMFFTPLEAIARTAASSNAEMFALSESDNNVASPYVIITAEQKVYNGWNYIETLADTSIKTGLQMNVNGTWGDWSYIRTVNAEGAVPFNRAVDAAGKVMQLSLVPNVTNVGMLNTDGQNGILTFVLPGGSYNDRKYEMVGASSALNEDGSVINFGIYADRGVAQLGYALYRKLEINNESCRDVVLAAINNGSMEVITLVDNGSDKNLNMTFTPPTGGGGYTLLVAGYDAAGQLCSTAYTSIDCLGPEVQGCNNISMNVAHDSVRSDTQLTIEIKGSDITSAYYSCLPAGQFGSMNDEELKQAALTNFYGYLTGYLDFVNGDGYTQSFVDLVPSTEYVVFGWFEDSNGGYSFIRHNITTAAETEWTLLGKGMFYDKSWQFSQEGALTDGFAAEVDIYQATSGKHHYRIAKPYESYWQLYPQLFSGNCSEWLEVAGYPMTGADGVTTVALCYDPHYTGMIATYISENDSELIVEHPNGMHLSAQKYPMREKHHSAYLNGSNRMLSEGVLQIQPWYSLSDTGVGYNYTQASETIIVTLPGYSFEFSVPEESASVAAKDGKPRGSGVRPAVIPTGEGGVSIQGGSPQRFEVKLTNISSVDSLKELKNVE